MNHPYRKPPPPEVPNHGRGRAWGSRLDVIFTNAMLVVLAIEMAAMVFFTARALWAGR